MKTKFFAILFIAMTTAFINVAISRYTYILYCYKFLFIGYIDS